MRITSTLLNIVIVLLMVNHQVFAQFQHRFMDTLQTVFVPTAIDLASDNGYIVAGEQYLPSPFTWDSFLLRTTDKGNLVWANYYKTSTNQMNIVVLQFLTMLLCQ